MQLSKAQTGRELSTALANIEYVNTRYTGEAYKKFTAHMAVTVVQFLKDAGLTVESATPAAICDSIDLDWKIV
jgi:hypothetical protein